MTETIHIQHQFIVCKRVHLKKKRKYEELTKEWECAFLQMNTQYFWISNLWKIPAQTAYKYVYIYQTSTILLQYISRLFQMWLVFLYHRYMGLEHFSTPSLKKKKKCPEFTSKHANVKYISRTYLVNYCSYEYSYECLRTILLDVTAGIPWYTLQWHKNHFTFLIISTSVS